MAALMFALAPASVSAQGKPPANPPGPHCMYGGGAHTVGAFICPSIGNEQKGVMQCRINLEEKYKGSDRGPKDSTFWDISPTLPHVCGYKG